MESCRWCGEQYKPAHDPKRAEYQSKYNACFSCAFWLEHHERDRAWDYGDVGIGLPLVVNGVHYMVGDENEKGPVSWRGHGGAKFVIKLNDGRIVTSTNLWCQGAVPERFKSYFPDTAVFIEDGYPTFRSQYGKENS